MTKEYIADKETLDAVNSKVGDTTDTGGTSSAGTVMGKNNATLEKLEELGIDVQELLMLLGQGMTARCVKSVQRGEITITASKGDGIAAITSVNVDKSIVIFGGISYVASNGNDTNGSVRLRLTSSTTVTATRQYASGYTAYIPYQVIEFV